MFCGRRSGWFWCNLRVSTKAAAVFVSCGVVLVLWLWQGCPWMSLWACWVAVVGSRSAELRAKSWLCRGVQCCSLSLSLSLFRLPKLWDLIARAASHRALWREHPVVCRIFRSRRGALGPYRVRRLPQSPLERAFRERLMAFRVFRSRCGALGPHRARRIPPSPLKRAFSGV